ncbi:MAG: alpha/beta hydrolase [Eubacteriales bacterium]|nr:alpha/beta hydrolase [Eubacteriales bacterium]
MDIQMNYIERGSGRPLLMIHGNEDCCEYFLPQLDFFSKRGFRCIAPDSRAHGKTPRGGGKLTIRRIARDMIEFLDEMEIEKADVIGFSDGGNVALIMAMKYPERIGHLVVYGANLDPSGVKPSVQAHVERDYAEMLAQSDHDKKARVRAEILNLMIHDPNIAPAELERIQAPTLVLAGTKDLILPEHTELIASRIPGAELDFVTGSHFCSSENPEEFNRRVLSFLEK